VKNSSLQSPDMERTKMDIGTSIRRRLQRGWTRFADRIFGETAGTEHETSRGEFTSAFISDKSLAEYRLREDRRRNAFRAPAP
jgi:hypothetical protein